jgi:hypothetical protein
MPELQVQPHSESYPWARYFRISTSTPSLAGSSDKMLTECERPRAMCVLSLFLYSAYLLQNFFVDRSNAHR